MPMVEVYEDGKDAPLLVAQFDAVPRAGKAISRRLDGYFVYYDVTGVWHREKNGGFRACVSVRLDD